MNEIEYILLNHRDEEIYRNTDKSAVVFKAYREMEHQGDGFSVTIVTQQMEQLHLTPDKISEQVMWSGCLVRVNNDDGDIVALQDRDGLYFSGIVVQSNNEEKIGRPHAYPNNTGRFVRHIESEYMCPRLVVSERGRDLVDLMHEHKSVFEGMIQFWARLGRKSS